MLIDATYAGLLTGAADAPLVIPALNRDGDCLSDLVMPMFGSIAGAESILLAFDDDFAVDVAMAEAPHGTAPSLQGKDLANPMAMILACAAVLGQAAARGYDGAERASRAIYEATLETTAGGVKTIDLGGQRHDGRVHRRGDREGADEGRDLVDALTIPCAAGRARARAASCGGGRAHAGRSSVVTPASTIAHEVDRQLRHAPEPGVARRGTPPRSRCWRRPGSS